LPSIIAALLNGDRSIDFENWLRSSPREITEKWARYCREFAVPQVWADLANSPCARDVRAIVCKLGEASGKLRERCDVLSELIPQLPRSRDAAADLDAIVSNAQIKGDGGVKAWPDESTREKFHKAAEKL